MLPVWESWGAPLGRWGLNAFPIVESSRVYVIDGRRIWRFAAGRWEEMIRLPEEVRSGVALGEDTLLLGGLNTVYWIASRQVRSLTVEGTGWIYRIWRGGSFIALRGIQASLVARVQDERLLLSRVSGEWLGPTTQGMLLRRRDTLFLMPEEKVIPISLPSAWTEINEVFHSLWGINRKGELLVSSQRQPILKGVRAWAGPYLIGERALWSLPGPHLLWENPEPIYSAAGQRDIIAVLTPSELVLLYPEAPIKWIRRWEVPVTQVYREGQYWVAWQGETAIYPGGMRRYPVTLIEPAFHRGEWLWATPRGILRQNGQLFTAPGRYISAIATLGDRLAWASGAEVFIQNSGKVHSFRFPLPVRRLGWTGDTLTAWRAQFLYRWDGSQWRIHKLPSQPDDAFCHEGTWYFRAGMQWFRLNGQNWDTIHHPPWLFPLTLSYQWGRVLRSLTRGETTFVFTSLGLLALMPTAGSLPPLGLSAAIIGPTLKLRKEGYFTLPAERPFIELTWRAGAPFLPAALKAYYQLGEDPPLPLTESRVIFSLSRPGRVRLRLRVEHPWYAQGEKRMWEIEVQPPWHETWWARGSALLLIFLLGGTAFYVREWYHRRLQRRITEEREKLRAQTQQQQTQLLQAERMANLGLMAAHIAHEINTPLGVIRSALAEALESLPAQRENIPIPSEPRPSAQRMRALRDLWQAAHPRLSPAQIQQLAAVGYIPDQWSALQPYAEDPQKWETLLSSIRLSQALQRAAEAAERLHSRIQSIRTYVRGIEESTAVPIALAESLRATVDFYRPMLRRVEVELIFPEKPLYVCASPARIEQVWANLIQNALQAMPDGGKLTLRIEEKQGYACVYVQDTGKGIPPHLREAIFQPLFTTKAPGEGTGLGLPLCRQIVESYGGNLRLLHSEPGYTLFGVELPLCEVQEKGEV